MTGVTGLFKKILILFTLSLLSFSNFAEEISYSGRLVEPTTGTPLTGPVSLSIKIYTEFPTSTFNLRCSQNSPSTNLSNGVFNIQLSYSSRCDSNTKNLSEIIEEASTNNQKLYIEVEDTIGIGSFGTVFAPGYSKGDFTPDPPNGGTAGVVPDDP